MITCQPATNLLSLAKVFRVFVMFVCFFWLEISSMGTFNRRVTSPAFRGTNRDSCHWFKMRVSWEMSYKISFNSVQATQTPGYLDQYKTEIFQIRRWFYQCLLRPSLVLTDFKCLASHPTYSLISKFFSVRQVNVHWTAFAELRGNTAREKSYKITTSLFLVLVPPSESQTRRPQ